MNKLQRVFFFFAVNLLSSQVVLAAQSLEQGVQLYKERQFKAAAEAFNRCEPKTSIVYYYLGLCYSSMQNYKHAEYYYKLATTVSPGSQAAQLAAVALANFQSGRPARSVGAAAPGHSASSSNYQSSQAAAASTLDDCPNECSIPFTIENKDIMIACEFNNRRISMCLDTGAPDCWIGTNHLAELGVNAPTGSADKMQSQLGDNTFHKYWNSNYNFKVGVVRRSNFPFCVQENRQGPPLIGQTFLAPFEYSIDYGAKQLRLKRRTQNVSRPSTAHDPYALPFVKTDGYIMVQGEVNGRPCTLCFDTGAANVCFSSAQCKKLGIEIQEGVPVIARRLRIGPVEKSDVPIRIIDSENMDCPLLGQSFYSDWQYTIDNERNVIHFLRR